MEGVREREAREELGAELELSREDAVAERVDRDRLRACRRSRVFTDLRSDRDSRKGAGERPRARVRLRRGRFSPLSVSSDFSSSLLELGRSPDSSPEDSDEGGGWACRWRYSLAVARAAASSRPRTGRPRVAALSVLPAAVSPGARGPSFVARLEELAR